MNHQWPHWCCRRLTKTSTRSFFPWSSLLHSRWTQQALSTVASARSSSQCLTRRTIVVSRTGNHTAARWPSEACQNTDYIRFRLSSKIIVAAAAAAASVIPYSSIQQRACALLRCSMQTKAFKHAKGDCWLLPYASCSARSSSWSAFAPGHSAARIGEHKDATPLQLMLQQQLLPAKLRTALALA